MHTARLITLIVFLVAGSPALSADDSGRVGEDGRRPLSVELVRLSRSALGGDLFHCVSAGLQGYPLVRLVERDADWQVKIAVTTRPFLGPDTRLVHLTLLHRVDPDAPGVSSADNARPLVAGYRIHNVVIRPIALGQLPGTCHSIVRDLVFRHLRR